MNCRECDTPLTEPLWLREECEGRFAGMVESAPGACVTKFRHYQPEIPQNLRR